MKTIVIGAGPAGMMAALEASNQSDVIIIEKMDETGKKLLLTGGKRCNISPALAFESFFDGVIDGKKFLYSSMYAFTPNDLLTFVKSLGLHIIKENDKYYIEEGAKEFRDRLEKKLLQRGVQIKKNTVVTDILIENNEVKGIQTHNRIFYCDRLIMCTGGSTYSFTGSDGMLLSRMADRIEVDEFIPSVGPILLDASWIKKLQGVRLESVELMSNKMIKKGDLLFTSNGVTGPVALNSSAYVKRGDVIRLNPITDNEELILQKLYRERNKKIESVLRDFLPKSFVDVLSDRDERLKQTVKALADKTIQDCLNRVTNIECRVTGVDQNRAIVSRGGVKLKSINPSTLESKAIKGLYFAGETISCVGESGGYNLQIAFSTGYLAGQLL